MRILFTRFPLESAYGGAEIQTLSLMRGLRERGHDVSFLGSCPVMLDLCERHRIPAKTLDIGPPPVSKWRAFAFIYKQFAMRKKLKMAFISLLRPHAIVMLSLSEKLLLTPIAVEHGASVYWLEHDRIGKWLTMSPWLRRLKKLSTQVTTICVSLLSKKLYIELGWPEERVVDIPNGIDMHRFARHEKDADQTKSLHIGCVARLTRDKGVDLLVRAVQHLPSVQLTIIGTGRDEYYIRDLISKLDLKNRVVLQSSYPELGNFYQFIDVLVLPSRKHDPFGLVAAEAMALGTPVVVTDACGIADYLGKESFVVPANSEEALVEAIGKLRDPILRTHLRETVIQVANEQFSLPQMIRAYEKLLTQKS